MYMSGLDRPAEGSDMSRDAECMYVYMYACIYVWFGHVAGCGMYVLMYACIYVCIYACPHASEYLCVDVFSITNHTHTYVVIRTYVYVDVCIT